MNYLSHYFLDRQRKEPLYVLGIIFPDLFRVGDRKRRLPELDLDKFESENHKVLQAGVNKHHLVDRLFHNAQFFHKYSKAISKELRDAELTGMPRFQHFYGHILLEILLDKKLVRDDEKLLPDFYELLDQIDLKEVETYLLKLDMQQHFESFSRNLEDFKAQRFLDDYAQAGGVENAMTKISERMHGYDLSSTEDQEKLRGVVLRGLDLIEADYQKIYTTISSLCSRPEIS